MAFTLSGRSGWAIVCLRVLPSLAGARDASPASTSPTSSSPSARNPRISSTTERLQSQGSERRRIPAGGRAVAVIVAEAPPATESREQQPGGDKGRAGGPGCGSNLMAGRRPPRRGAVHRAAPAAERADAVRRDGRSSGTSAPRYSAHGRRQTLETSPSVRIILDTSVEPRTILPDAHTGTIHALSHKAQTAGSIQQNYEFLVSFFCLKVISL